MAKGPAIKAGDEVFPVNRLSNTVGRHDRITDSTPDIDLAELDTERGVSRKHAELTYANGAILLRDAGSINGTRVNGESLAPQVDRYLRDGDEVAFGGLETVFVAQAEWPQGVEAEWPPEPELGSLRGETMVIPPSVHETMVMAPSETEQQSTTPPAEAVVDPEAEPVGGAEPEVEPVGATEPQARPGGREPVAEPVATLPVDMPPAAEPSVVSLACSNHPDIAAIGTCPGCLEGFCADCMPERAGQPLVCARCVGIHERLNALIWTAAPAHPAPPPEPASTPATEPPPPAPEPPSVAPLATPAAEGFQPAPGFAAPPSPATVEAMPPPPEFPPPPAFAVPSSPETEPIPPPPPAPPPGFPPPPSQPPDVAPPPDAQQADPPKRKMWPF